LPYKIIFCQNNKQNKNIPNESPWVFVKITNKIICHIKEAILEKSRKKLANTENTPLKTSIYRHSKTLESCTKTRKKENMPNPWVEYWNLQKNVRKHNDPNAKVYVASGAAAEEILRGLSSKKRWDSRWIAKNNIPEKVLYEPWAPVVLKRAIRVIDTMLEPGCWPGPCSWLAKISMAECIYNPRAATSMMVLARCVPKPKSFFEKMREDQWENASPQAQTIAAPLREMGVDIGAAVAENIAKQYNMLCETNPLLVHISGGLEGFGRMLARWLLEQGIQKPGYNIRPPSGYLWRRFSATFGGS
jgi:hypothetical protein